MAAIRELPKYEMSNYQMYKPYSTGTDTRCMRVWLDGFPESGIRQEHYNHIRAKLPGFDLVMHNVIACERNDKIPKPKIRFAVEGSLESARRLVEPSGKTIENILMFSAGSILVGIFILACSYWFDLDG